MAYFIAHKFAPLLLPVLLMGLTGCSREERYSGYIEGEYSYIASSQSGHLDELSVRRGEWVDAGAPLFQLDSVNDNYQLNEALQNLKIAEFQLENIKKGKREVEITALRATLEQAKILQDIAETRFNRNNKLAKTGAVSQDQFDESQSVFQRNKSDVIEREAELELGLLGGRSDEISAAEANVRAKQEELNLVQWRLSEKKLSAREEAYVQDTLFNPGEWVPAGRPVVSLLSPTRVKVCFFIPEKALAKLQLGQTLKIHCDACSGSLSAKVNYISSEAEFTPPVIFSRESRTKLVYRVEAKLEETEAKLLHPGQPIDILVNYP